MALCSLEYPLQCNVQLWFQSFQIIFNSIVGLIANCGIVLVSLAKVGIFGELTILDHYKNVDFSVFLTCSIILSIISTVGIFLSFRNCYKSSIVYGISLGIFLTATIIYIIAISVITDYSSKGNLYNQMRNEMIEYNSYRQIIDKLQITLSCCGLEGVATWNIWNLPLSCCSNNQNQTECLIDSPNLQTNGCFKELVRIIHYYTWLFFIVFILSGLLQIFEIILSYLQYRVIKNIKQKKLTRESLRIPRARTTSTLEYTTCDNEEKKNEEEMKDVKNFTERNGQAGTSTQRENDEIAEQSL